MRNEIKREKSKDAEKIWVIRAGVGGEADHLFLSGRVIVLRDPGMGNLKKLPSRREAFYEAYGKLRPDETRTGITGIGGKFFRFVHEIAVGDLVLYPSLKDKQLHIGRITGDYRYVTKPHRSFPHQRRVVWLYTIPKWRLSEFAHRELGAARTFFRLKNHAAEIKKILTAMARRMPKTIVGSKKSHFGSEKREGQVRLV